MSIEEIESAIRRLSDKEVSELSVWLADYRASLWDSQIASDLDAGRLDEVLAQVDAEYDQLLS
jgi:hypothetical protein